MAGLKTRIVFIDASIFVGLNFSFEAEVMRSLAGLTKTNSVEVKLTDITAEEVKSNIRKAVHDAAQGLGPFRKKARILRNLTADPRFDWLFGDFPTEEVCAKIQDAFLKFINSASAEVLPASSSDPGPVFERYFAGKAPFGPGKKKSEFPDAFVAAALEGWCKTTGTEIYVISADGDLQNACANSSVLHHLSSLNEFVSLVLESDDDLVKLVEHRVEAHSESIRKAIEERFLDNGAWLEDQTEGDVTDVEVAAVEFHLHDLSVLRVSEREAVVELPAMIDYRAHYEYPDPASCFYDSEDRQTYYFNTIRGETDGLHKCSAELTVAFSQEDEEEFEVAGVSLDGNEPLSVIADEDAWNHYK